jgi:hypothetical protein
MEKRKSLRFSVVKKYKTAKNAKENESRRQPEVIYTLCLYSAPTGLIFRICYFFYQYLRGAASKKSSRAAKYL